MTARIFQIGFNKCGTRTIFHFFKANGLASIHWDGGHLAETLCENARQGRALIAGYEKYRVFTDMEQLDGKVHLEAFKLYPQLAKENPDALFILNTREREDWIKSRLRHRQGTYVNRFKRVLNVSDAATVTDHWRADWDAHHRAVREFFAGSPYRFLEFDIAKDAPETLVRALPEYTLHLKYYRARGRSQPKEQTTRA